MPVKGKILFIAGYSMLLPLLQSLQAAAPELTADDPIEFDQRERSMIARGNAELTSDEYLLQADRIGFNQDSNSAGAQGSVRLSAGSMRLLADEADYSLADASFATGTFRLGRAPLYIAGTSVSGALDKIVISDGTLYFSEPDNFGFNIRSRKITLHDQETAVLEGATLYLGPLPFFYLPYYQQNIHDGLPLRWRTNLGYNNYLGAYIQNDIFYRATPDISVGGLLDFYSKRGPLIGPAFEISSDSAPHWIRSDFRSGFIDDKGDPGFDSLGRPIRNDRFFMEWRHRQAYGDRVDIIGRASWWRDSETLRDFRSDWFSHNQQPETFLEASFRGDYYILSTFTRPSPNDYQIIQEKLPEIRFDLLPVRLLDATGTFLTFDASFTRLREKDPYGGPQLESNRFDSYLGLLQPITLTPWLSVTPVTGVRTTHYEKTTSSRSSYTRILGQVGFDAQMQISGHWNYRNETWNIDGLRHEVRPILQYRYIPRADAGRSDIPMIERDPFATYLPVIDLQDTRNVDDLFDTNVIRMGIENTLETRDPVYGSRTLAAVNFYQDYRFSTRPATGVPGSPLFPFQPAENDWSDLYTEIRLAPVYWFDFTLFNRFDPERLTLQQIQTRSRITDGDRWQLIFWTNSLQGQYDQYAIEGRYRFTERYAVRARLRYDARLGKMVEQVYALRTHLGHSWAVEYYIAYREGSQRGDNNFQFGVRVDLLQF